MPINTIITLIIGIFGANITLIAALRGQHDGEVRKISENITRTVNEFLTLIGGSECPGKDAALKAQNEVPKYYKRWTRALSWPTWAFAVYVMITTVAFVFMKWPDSADGQASANQVTDFIVSHCYLIKVFIGVFLVFNLGCFGVAIHSQKCIYSLNKKVEENTNNVKPAIENAQQGNHVQKPVS